MDARASSTWRTSCTARSSSRCAIATASRQFYLDYGLASIAWLDGQDFTPEFLYDKLKAMN